MEIVSTSRTIKIISKAGVYTALITSPSGDIIQMYSGSGEDENNYGTISPQYGEGGLQPILYFRCYSSRVDEPYVVENIENAHYYFNDDELVFDENNKCTTSGYENIFELVDPTIETPFYGVKILNNIVAVAGGVSAVFRFTAKINYGNSLTEDIQATYNARIFRSTGNTYFVTIGAGDSKYFTLTSKDDTCLLVAKAYEGVEALGSGLTYEWQRLEYDTTNNTALWKTITGQTSATLKVSESMVDSVTQFRVIVTKDGYTLGSDVQTVTDMSDPYEIQANPNPASESIDLRDSSAKLTYTPYVVARGTNEAVFSGTRFSFLLTDAVGNPYKNSTGTSCSITAEDVANIGSNANIDITAELNV